MKFTYRSTATGTIRTAELSNDVIKELSEEFKTLNQSTREKLDCNTAKEYIIRILELNR